MAISRNDLLKQLLPGLNEAFRSEYEKLIEYDYVHSHDPKLKKNVWVLFKTVNGIRKEVVNTYDTEEEAKGVAQLLKGIDYGSR